MLRIAKPTRYEPLPPRFSRSPGCGNPDPTTVASGAFCGYDTGVPDETDAVHAADLQIALRRHGRQLATVDAPIAALPLRYGLILLTTDRDFTAVPNLQQDNWLSAEKR